ncbi:TonB-dependent receptor [Sphingopyxis sp. DHUNG17]|uniref:TonB-dependent receptor n=1 Tax=Sphingopyxis jiangsuensis TaxID=2871171 RepID=UPI00191CA239|nr:TonB-dependent receptor [Sphingopyxis lutea]MBL0770046.1 TonB-dependent receptor [Sphingopyxis lutea]
MNMRIFRYAPVAALAICAQVRAEAADLSTSAQADTETTELQDIVVTAQRRTENLASAPMSISALSGEALQKADINGISDLYLHSPNVTFNTTTGAAQIFIRGVGTAVASFSVDGSVAISVDGVNLSRPAAALVDYFDVERVELVRGPQGTLYGRNATAGVLNILSKRPTREVEGYATATYGSFDRREIKGALSGPVGDKWAARIAGRIRRDDGFTKDLDPRGTNESDKSDVDAVRITLDSFDYDKVKVKLTADFIHQRQGSQTLRPLDPSGQAEALGASTPSGFHQTRNNSPARNDTKTYGVAAELNVDLGGIELVSITGVRSLKQRFTINTDGTEADVTETFANQDQTQFSQEIRLQSAEQDSFSWILGAYYLRDRVDGELAINRFSGTGATPATLVAPDGRSRTSAYAAFADATVKLTDRLELTMGARYSREEKRIRREFLFIGGVAGGLDAPNLAPAALRILRLDAPNYEAFSPRALLTYRPSRDVTIYASATKGFKSGGTGQADVLVALGTFAPPFANEQLWAYEAGIKGQTFDRKLYASLSAFLYDYTDLQVTTFQNGLNVIQNAATARPKGIEIELRARPTRDVTFGFTGAYLDARYGRFMSSLNNVPKDASGNRMISSPKWTASFHGEYVATLAGGSTISLNSSLNYRSAVDFIQFNFPLNRQKAVTLLNARATWTSSDERYSLSLFGKNLTDRRYLHNIVTFTSVTAPAALALYPQGTSLGYPAEGRSVNVEATLRF